MQTSVELKEWSFELIYRKNNKLFENDDLCFP